MNWKKYWISVFIIFFSMQLFHVDYKDCVMIGYNGGGYSGFWYYYGQLQKNYILDKKIYCFSAGCLAPVANIQHNNHKFILNIVNNLKINYNNNIIDRFDIRNQFIYEITNRITDISKYDLNILTSNYLGNCTIITPKTSEELINALNLTTNIPFITSKLNLSQNIDGGLCMNRYPLCKTIIAMPLTYKFLINIFNPNVNNNNDDIEYFMNY